MEIMQKKVEFNGENCVETSVYNIDNITDLEEGTIFGVIATKYYMNVVSPLVQFVNGHLRSCLATYDDLISDEFEIDTDAFGNGDDVPLILKKLDGNLAQELLSGEIFIVANKSNEDGINNLDVDIEKFQKDVERYENSNVMILCNAIEFESGKDISGIFTVDDVFKSLYSKETLSKKEEVIKALKSIKKQSKEHFDDCYKNCISVAEGVAYTENLIYDVKRKTRKI